MYLNVFQIEQAYQLRLIITSCTKNELVLFFVIDVAHL